jgi:hypothetical protein
MYHGFTVSLPAVQSRQTQSGRDFWFRGRLPTNTICCNRCLRQSHLLPSIPTIPSQSHLIPCTSLVAACVAKISLTKACHNRMVILLLLLAPPARSGHGICTEKSTTRPIPAPSSLNVSPSACQTSLTSPHDTHPEIRACTESYEGLLFLRSRLRLSSVRLPAAQRWRSQKLLTTATSLQSHFRWQGSRACQAITEEAELNINLDSHRHKMSSRPLLRASTITGRHPCIYDAGRGRSAS